MIFQDEYTLDKSHLVQLSVNAGEVLEDLIDEIEQIQEDIAEDDLDFVDLEQVRKDLISVKETFEKILKRNRSF